VAGISCGLGDPSNGAADWSLKLAAKWYPSLAALLPLQKAADAAARSLDHRALDQASVERFLHKLPAQRRLVVIIDDLDRAAPEVVPHLLLALREVFDIRECAFVLALDPRILAKAFPAVHPGWGTTGEFIEKIIQFPFWLPPATKADLLRLANSSLEELPVFVDRAAVRDLIDLVPANPRRLKQYFRNVLRLRAVIERHDDDEMKWSILLLFELMRAISPLVASELFRSDSFLKLLALSTLVPGDEKDEHGQKVRKDLQAEVSAAYKLVGAEDRGQEEFQGVIVAFGQRVGIIGDEGLKYWSRLDDDPPIFTWREFRSLTGAWRDDRTTDTLRRLVDDHGKRRGVGFDAVLADLYRTAIQRRSELLERAADVNLADDQNLLLRAAGEMLVLIYQLSLDLPGFSGKVVFGAEEFHLLYEHITHWAHFTNSDEYRHMRMRERDLLLQIAANAERFAVAELDRLQAWMPGHFFGRPDAAQLHREVVEALSGFVVADLRLRFSRENGIGSLWGRDRALTHKYFLFRLDSGFYTPDGLEFLRHTAGRAAESKPIQENFLEFLRLLTHGMTNGLGVVEPGELRALARHKEIVGIAWKAATVRRLQPRTAGSLAEFRKLLATVAESDEHLALPQWWPSATEEETGAASEGLQAPEEP